MISKKSKSSSSPWTLIILPFLVLIVVFIIYQLFTAIRQPDNQCTTSHLPVTPPPETLSSPLDFLTLGDFDYERGDCLMAIQDYTQAITLDPLYAEAYNSRAYTNMRLQNYAAALPDLNKALELKPNYILALMNRGDLRHYYYQIDFSAAIADYRQIISLGGKSHGSLCGHLYLAQHQGWNLKTILDLPLYPFSCH